MDLKKGRGGCVARKMWKMLQGIPFSLGKRSLREPCLQQVHKACKQYLEWCANDRQKVCFVCDHALPRRAPHQKEAWPVSVAAKGEPLVRLPPGFPVPCASVDPLCAPPFIASLQMSSVEFLFTDYPFSSFRLFPQLYFFSGGQSRSPFSKKIDHALKRKRKKKEEKKNNVCSNRHFP